MERTPSAIVMNGKVVSGLTIKEVSETYDISADTLRYYERIGMIPEVTRTAGGIRDYQKSRTSRGGTDRVCKIISGGRRDI